MIVNKETNIFVKYESGSHRYIAFCQFRLFNECVRSDWTAGIFEWFRLWWAVDRWSLKTINFLWPATIYSRQENLYLWQFVRFLYPIQSVFFKHWLSSNYRLCFSVYNKDKRHISFFNVCNLVLFERPLSHQLSLAWGEFSKKEITACLVAPLLFEGLK